MTQMNDSVYESQKTDTAIFAGGCFWGVEYFLQKLLGVQSVESGYTGGDTDAPLYEQVRGQTTGHAEAVKVVFNPSVTDYRTLSKVFFEIHDPTQINRQGPDTGNQYRSEIFYNSPEQKAIAEELIEQLKTKGYAVVTKVTPVSKFWTAEDYHQNYYSRNASIPYCHGYVKRFD